MGGMGDLGAGAPSARRSDCLGGSSNVKSERARGPLEYKTAALRRWGYDAAGAMELTGDVDPTLRHPRAARCAAGEGPG